MLLGVLPDSSLCQNGKQVEIITKMIFELCYIEAIIENSIVANVKNFILTFGKDFTFMGNQVHIDKFGHDHWVDLLFFNRELQCLVVFELKEGAFKPA